MSRLTNQGPIQRVPRVYAHLATLKEILHTKIAAILAIVYAVSIIALYWSFINLSSELTDFSSIKGAERYSETLAEFRTLYTSEVVASLSNHDIKVTHNYKNQDGAIPLPATLSMYLGEKIGEKGSGIQVDLFSPYPFPWREAEGGLKDNFKKEAWDKLTQNPNKPYFHFENIKGRNSVRYATADLMRTNCISCHNAHPDTPKNNWKEGDVRGVLEFYRLMKSKRVLNQVYVRYF